MMSRRCSLRRIVTICLPALALQCLLAGETAPSRGDLDRLIARLADPDVAVREEAAKGLGALDGSALPALRAALEASRDPDVRESLRKIILSLTEARVAMTLHAPRKTFSARAEVAFTLEVKNVGEGPLFLPAGNDVHFLYRDVDGRDAIEVEHGSPAIRIVVSHQAGADPKTLILTSDVLGPLGGAPGRGAVRRLEPGETVALPVILREAGERDSYGPGLYEVRAVHIASGAESNAVSFTIREDGSR